MNGIFVLIWYIFWKNVWRRTLRNKIII